MMDESDYNDVYDDAADEECTSPISPNYHASEQRGEEKREDGECMMMQDDHVSVDESR